MKRNKPKLLLFIILLIVIALAVILIVKRTSSKNSLNNSVPAAVNIVVTPQPTTDANAQAAASYDGEVPDGIYIVAAPSDAGTDISSSSNTSDYSGIYIVDAPDENAGSGSGIYIVDAPNENGSSSGITIVNTPSGSGSESYGKIIASGSFSSSTGTGINSLVTYNATTTGSNTVDVTVSVTLNHGQLQAKGGNVLSVTCAGNSGTINCPSINGSGSTFLGSKTFTVSLSSGQSKTININTSWAFGGTYSGNYIASVNAGGSVYLSR